MAMKPAKAGADSGLAGAPPPVHHQGFPRHPRTPPGHRARAASRPLAWLPCLIVLAGVAVGLFVTWQGSKYAGLGTGLVGGALLAAAAARLLLPPRYAELLSSRWKASDVVAFTVLGAAVLAIALVLP
jgi:hypothetical protein